MIGTSIAHYSITAKIGAGGMGEVWRATDTKLGRDVALKILPQVFSADAQRMARFQREAQLLASLNHPNIAAIYGVEESGGKRALVLELVEGPDLQERLKAGPIPIEEALDVARQIAEALEAAHEKGVVHRDLKPANVKLTPGGTVKVLDFGLAKALEEEPAVTGSDPAPSQSPTLTQAATSAGVVLGTAAYMSPEQAKGRSVDRRSDIFSFGVLLFETLVGGRVFTGETASETLASVMKDEPDWGALPAETPPAVRLLLRRCMEKDLRRRLQSIGEARILLEDLRNGRSEPVFGVAAAPGREPEGTRAGGNASRVATWMAALAVAVAAAAWAGWRAGRLASPGAEPRIFSIDTGTLDLGFTRGPVLSPDGRNVAYSAEGRLWIRRLDALEPRPVEGGDDGRALFWSPDSANLGFATGRQLKRLDLETGDIQVITELPFDTLGSGAWAPDGMLYLSPVSGALHSVPARGGEVRKLFELNRALEIDFHTPSVLPGGRGILYVVHRTEGGDTLEIFSEGRRTRIYTMEDETIDRATLTPGGLVLYQRKGANPGTWSLPLSISTLEITGPPALVSRDRGYPSVSTDGSLLGVEGGEEGLSRLAWVDREGNVVEELGEELEGISWPSVSPDGTRVLFTLTSEGKSDIWSLDLETGARSRVTFLDEADSITAGWLPGGRRIAVSRGSWANYQTYTTAADGSGDLQPLLDGAVPSFTPDESLVAFVPNQTGETGFDIHYMDLRQGGEPAPFLVTPDSEGLPRLSPDGRYVAYVSVASGKGEIYLRTFPDGAGPWQVSTEGGFTPLWRRDGKEIFWRDTASGSPGIWSATVETEPRVRTGRPVRLFGQSENPALLLEGAHIFDISPEGDLFLTAVRTGSPEDVKPARLVLTLNWRAARGEGRAE